jgi:tetratricopeptide (TPR) repeat protein
MTDNLEAYRYYSLGLEKAQGFENAQAIVLFQKAIDHDPKFAMAHAMLGFTYGVIGERTVSAESNRTAFQLRDRASDREKFFITANYDLQVTGDLEKARQTCELWSRTYPRDIVPHLLDAALAILAHRVASLLNGVPKVLSGAFDIFLRLLHGSVHVLLGLEGVVLGLLFGFVRALARGVGEVARL